MSDALVWTVGNRDPSITETITSDGVAVDLTGKTVKFKMRALRATTLKVDAAAVVVSAPAGTVRYDWAAADVDTDGYFLCWWEVTTTAGGKTQDMLESVIEFRAHAPETNAYVELEELKSTAELTGTGFADEDLQLAIVAASRGIDDALDRRFWQDADASQIRYYTPYIYERLWTDDIVTLTELASDSGGDGTFEDVWTLNTDYTLQPLNAAADGKPYTHIQVHPTSSLYLPCGYPRSVRVTGRFGWPAVPYEIRTLTRLIALRLLKRTREAPLGFVELGVDGAAVRASGYARDPEYMFLTEGLSRSVLAA